MEGDEEGVGLGADIVGVANSHGADSPLAEALHIACAVAELSASRALRSRAFPGMPLRISCVVRQNARPTRQGPSVNSAHSPRWQTLLALAIVYFIRMDNQRVGADCMCACRLNIIRQLQFQCGSQSSGA